MKIIVTSDGKEVQVSDEDYDYLKQFNWSTNGEHYVHRRINSRKSAMHHEIALRMGWKFTLIDHKDQKPFNNQRENLRVATKSQNMMNRPAPRGNSYSHHKGVTFNISHRKWHTRIGVGKYRLHIGYYDTEKEAALAYNEAALRIHGEFAYLNEVE